MIIGKGGNFIKQVKDESGAYVQISQKSKDVSLPERCVTIAGSSIGFIIVVNFLAQLFNVNFSLHQTHLNLHQTQVLCVVKRMGINQGLVFSDLRRNSYFLWLIFVNSKVYKSSFPTTKELYFKCIRIILIIMSMFTCVKVLLHKVILIRTTWQ